MKNQILVLSAVLLFCGCATPKRSVFTPLWEALERRPRRTLQREMPPEVYSKAWWQQVYRDYNRYPNRNVLRRYLPQ